MADAQAPDNSTLWAPGDESDDPAARLVYLDNNATTPIDPRVADAMTAVLRRGFGNPSSGHAFGRAAKAAYEEARDRGLLELRAPAGK